MKYIITESQYELLSELERDWRTSEYSDEYPKLRDKMVPLIINRIKSYSKSDDRINLYDSDNNRILSFLIYKGGDRGELFFSRDFADVFEKMLPHPLWYVHDKYLMSDVFESLFPDKKVVSVRSANMS